MKTIEFSDHDGTRIKVQMSSLATEEAFRIFFEGEQAVPHMHMGQEIPAGLHLTRHQAEILIHALQDLFTEEY